MGSEVSGIPQVDEDPVMRVSITLEEKWSRSVRVGRDETPTVNLLEFQVLMATHLFGGDGSRGPE